MRSLFSAVGTIAIGVALAVTVVAAALSESPIRLAVAGRANANVSLAARNAFVVAVWSGALPSGSVDVFSAVSRDGGRSFAAPVRVNSDPGRVSVNGEQPPRLALVARKTAAQSPPEIVVVWTAKGPQGTLLMTSVSRDGGRTFAPAAPVPDTDAPGNRGWENIAADSAGRVHITWLDHRALAKDGAQTAMSHHDIGHSAKTDGVAMAQQSKLYYGTLATAGSPVRPITGGVCYCCKTAVTPIAAGGVALAWRHVYPGNFRDIAFTVSRDGGRTFATPVRVSEDGWQLEGCPDDGPAMAVDRDGTIHLAWPTLVAGNGKDATTGIFYARSRDGLRFSPRVAVPSEGTPHHPQLTSRSDGSIALAWDEVINGSRRIAFATGTAGRDGRVAFTRRMLSGLETGMYPALAVASDGLVVAWTSGAPDTAVISLLRNP